MPEVLGASLEVLGARSSCCTGGEQSSSTTVQGMETSPEKWRESSIHGIKLAHTIIETSGLAVDDGKLTDPLPQLRDACIKQSNDRIRAYMRVTRAVVVRLRRSFVEVNDEITSSSRCRESLEKSLEHKRKDLALNKESQDVRYRRPSREKVRHDILLYSIIPLM